MSGDHQRVIDLRSQQVVPDVRRALWLGTVLQFGLRAVLIVLVVATLLWEPPDHYEWVCVTIPLVYVVVTGCWIAWALRRGGAHDDIHQDASATARADRRRHDGFCPVDTHRRDVPAGLDIRRDAKWLLPDSVDRG